MSISEEMDMGAEETDAGDNHPGTSDNDCSTNTTAEHDDDDNNYDSNYNNNDDDNDADNDYCGSKEHPQAARARSTRNHYADPYRVVENHYHSNDVTRLHYATPEITYAKPEIYSTFINPSFYEDVYARWRLQEQARHEKTYDSPWQYRFSRIPRGKLTSESERDETETVAMDPQSFTTF
nr:hypothetical protein BaRGS_005943 [Batillaria attramentaria]